MNAPLLLAIDVGGTAVKVVVFDLEGRQQAHHNAVVEARHYPDGRVEHDVEQLWQATTHAIRAAVTECGVNNIGAVASTGFGNGIFLVDEEGNQTFPGIVSVDHRADWLVEEIMAEGKADHISKITGHRLWGGQTLMQLAHLAKREPEAMNKTRWALSAKDLMRFRLTGAALTDPTDASGGGLLNLECGQYGHSVFQTLGIEHVLSKLPPIAESTTIAGRISLEAAEQTGLKQGLPVAGSMMDVAACTLGAGGYASDFLTMIAGTWSINCIETRKEALGAAPLLNMLYRQGESRLIADGSPSSAANLGWFLKEVLSNKLSHQEADDAVNNCPVTARRCEFMPYIFGPAPLSGAFKNLSSADNQASMLRAIYEAVALQHLMHAEIAIASADRVKPGVIRLTGGAARSPVWAQIFADVCQAKIEAVEAEEVGALGAAMCAAVAAGFHPDLKSAIAAMTRVDRCHEPNQNLKQFYQQRYQKFKEAGEAMKALKS